MLKPVETGINVQKISLLIFMFLGATHILAGVFIQKEAFPTVSTFIYRSFDIPFLLSAILYGFSSLYLHLSSEENPNVFLAITLGFITLILLSASIYINFFIPDL